MQIKQVGPIDLDSVAASHPEADVLVIEWEDGATLRAECFEGEVSGAWFDESLYVVEGDSPEASEWLARQLSEIPNSKDYLLGIWGEVL
ncbi:MAG: hypothetical protein ABJZ55_07520 [Fuerstiella sp.]